METQPQPMSTVRRAASSRLQIWSSTTTPSTRHSLKCYTINARSRGNRSASAQDQDNSDSEASQRNLVDQNGSDDESYVDEDGSDSAGDHELEPPRRRRRATTPPVPVPPPAGPMDLDAQNACRCVRRLQRLDQTPRHRRDAHTCVTNTYDPSSTQVEAGSQPAAAAPHGDDEEPGPERRRASIQDLKIEKVPGPYGNEVYVFDDEGKRLVEVAVSKTSRVPSGSGGDQFTDTNGIHYLCSSIPQTACQIAGTTYYLKNGVGHALDAASGLLANAIKQKWPGQNNLYVVTLVPSEDTATRPAHADYKLAEKLVEKAGVTHVKGVLSQPEEIGRPAFDASLDERQRFQFAHPVEVDGTKFPDLPDGSTVFLVARSFVSGAKLLSAKKELRDFFADRPSITIEPIAFSKTITTRWRGPRPATLLKGDVFETLAKAEIKEWESIDGTSEENTDGWGIVYSIKDPEVMPGDYRGSTATQAKTSATDSRKLVQSCGALKTKEAFDAAVCCLKIRADQHQGE